MKKLSLKFAVGFLALVLGVAVVWASGIYKVLFPLPATQTAPVAEISTRQTSTGNSGKALIRFKDFEYGKTWIANFEITNETAQPIFYIGSNRKYKFDYCTLAVKHEEPFPANPDGKIENLSFKVRDTCYFEKFISLQTLKPGESLILSVEEYEVRSMLNIKDAKQDTKAQFGFEFFVGEEKRREILMSEEISFPYDEYR